MATLHSGTRTKRDVFTEFYIGLSDLFIDTHILPVSLLIDQHCLVLLHFT